MFVRVRVISLPSASPAWDLGRGCPLFAVFCMLSAAHPSTCPFLESENGKTCTQSSVMNAVEDTGG